MNYLFDNLIKREQNKILCLAKNYLKHVKEMGGKEVPPYPLIFGKPWSSLIYEPNPVKIKTKENHKIDHEVELGFVISKTAKKIKKENYLDYIEAYFICLDLTDRSFQQESKVNGWPWFYSKGQDSFLPISRFIERSKVIDPHNLELTLFINNQVRQQDNTGNMHYKIGETLEHLSYYVTLNKGDLILTGTPSGIGAISVGDKLLAQLKQDDKILVEMKYDVIEEEKEKEILPKF